MLISALVSSTPSVVSSLETSLSVLWQFLVTFDVTKESSARLCEACEFGRVDLQPPAGAREKDGCEVYSGRSEEPRQEN